MKKWISRTIIWLILLVLIVLTFLFPESRYIKNTRIILNFSILFANAIFLICIVSMRLKDGKPINTSASVVTCATSLVRTKNEHSTFSTTMWFLLAIALSVSGHLLVGLGMLMLKFFSAALTVTATKYLAAFRREDIS